MIQTSATSRDDAIRILRDHVVRMRKEFGVRSLKMFGSLARGNASESSDVDLLVEFNRPTGFFGLIRLQLFLQQLLGREVDLGTAASLRPEMRRRVEQESIGVA